MNFKVFNQKLNRVLNWPCGQKWTTKTRYIGYKWMHNTSLHHSHLTKGFLNFYFRSSLRERNGHQTPKIKIQKCLQNFEISLYWAKLIYYSTFESSILRLKLGNWRNSQYKETHMDRYFKMSCQISVYNLILIEFSLPKKIDISSNYHLPL